MEFQKDVERLRILSGPSMKEFLRKAQANQANATRSEFLFVELLLDNFHDKNLVPTSAKIVEKDGQEVVEFYGWCLTNGHEQNVVGIYEDSFQIAYIEASK